MGMNLATASIYPEVLLRDVGTGHRLEILKVVSLTGPTLT
jgi:hypothetical protein